MTKIAHTEHSAIIQEVAEAYEDWRGHYGAPKTKAATLRMVEDVLSPLLERLSAWDDDNKSAHSILEDIKNLIACAETMKPTQQKGD